MTSDGDKESLTHTPTWAVAVVCVIIVVVSLLVERGIHVLGKLFLRNKQKPLYEALQKMKEELMLLGFISLLLTVSRNAISKLCMPEAWGDHLLPCPDSSITRVVAGPPAYSPQEASQNVSINRRLHSLDSSAVSALIGKVYVMYHRVLAEGAPQRCKEGYRLVFPSESLHQLHIFIFVMAVVHVLYSGLTMLLGFTQLRSWRKWEEETSAENYDFVEGIKRSFRLQRQITFVTSRARNPWFTSWFGSWVASFLRQFGNAVTKSDYLSLRMGFVKTHNASKKFNFHVYMMRTLEDDFKQIVGISGYLWIFVVIFMILNVHGWYAYFWISFIPILINMIIGTKLQHIITQLALETAQSHISTRAPIKPRDELFWFSKPQLLLYMIHFVLFQNAFELSFCLWLLFTFGIHSCLIDKHGFIAIRVVVGFLAQVLCSYSTLPLYALVTQMGSQYKKAIFNEPLKSAIHGWRSKAKESSRMRQKKKYEELKSNSATSVQPSESNFELANLFEMESSVQPSNIEEKAPIVIGENCDVEVGLASVDKQETEGYENGPQVKRKVHAGPSVSFSEESTRGKLKYHILGRARSNAEISRTFQSNVWYDNPIATLNIKEHLGPSTQDRE
ncbi:unnamed protein product [Calypogeia fissa]